jgi:hypothetical protein
MLGQAIKVELALSNWPAWSYWTDVRNPQGRGMAVTWLAAL